MLRQDSNHLVYAECVHYGFREMDREWEVQSGPQG